MIDTLIKALFAEIILTAAEPVLKNMLRALLSQKRLKGSNNSLCRNDQRLSMLAVKKLHHIYNAFSERCERVFKTDAFF